MTICSRKVLSLEYRGVDLENPISSVDVSLPERYGWKPRGKSLSDPAFYLVKTITADYIELEGGFGTRLLRTPDDFFSLMSLHKTNWVGSNSLTEFLRWFTPEDVEGFYPPFNRPIQYKEWTLGGFPSLGRYIINNRNTVNMVNHFASPSFKIDSVDAVKLCADKLTELDNLFWVDTTSPGSTSSRTLLNTVRGIEFDFISQTKDTEGVELQYKAFFALRQENAYMGYLGNIHTMDMVRAFLVKLGSQLSYSPRYNVISRAPKYLKHAHAGWAEIEVNIPEGLFLPPVPWRDPVMNFVIYPTGTFRTIVAKPFLDLLDDMRLPFKIIRAQWLIPTVANRESPFKTLVNLMLTCLDNYVDYFYPVNLKAFYFSIIGHMIHMHEVLDDNGQIFFETSRDFLPGCASMVSAQVACEVYRIQAAARNPLFFSADGGGAESYPVEVQGFKYLQGDALSFNPSIKDKPGKAPGKNLGLLKDFLEKNRDAKSIKTRLPFLITPQTTITNPTLWGTTVDRSINLRGSCGHRWLESTYEYLGDLLDRKFKSKPPYMVSEKIAAVSDYKGLAVSQIVTLERLIEEGKA